MKGRSSFLRKVVMVVIPALMAAIVALSKSYEDLGFSSEQMPTVPLFTSSSSSQGGLLTDDEVKRYKRDGFIVKRSLVTGDELVKLTNAVKEAAEQFFWTDLLFQKFYKKVEMQTWKSKREIARFAFESNLPSISAQLLDEKKSIRILKDAVFAHTSNKNGCGFHIDDKGFWPAENSNGVTFWIALSPTRISQGGGIRVAKGTHTAEWALECRQAIENKTCDMEQLHPECNKKLHQVSETHDMEPGDAILWDRYLFHRGEPFHEDTNDKKLRYTIRYVPEGATAVGLHHGSVKTGAPLSGAHYPQVWPKALPDEVDGFARFGNSLRARFLPFI